MGTVFAHKVAGCQDFSLLIGHGADDVAFAWVEFHLLAVPILRESQGLLSWFVIRLYSQQFLFLVTLHAMNPTVPLVACV